MQTDTKPNSPTGFHGTLCTCAYCEEQRRAAHAVATQRLELALEPAPDTEPENEKPVPELERADYQTSHGGSRGEDCAVEANCDRGTPDDWFEVHYPRTGEIFHFCKRHAFAAEALVTLGGWRARDVPEGLRMLERGGARALPTLTHTATIVKCGQANCPSLAVHEYDWPGAGTCYACLPCSVKAQNVARAMGFSVVLRPLPGAAQSLVTNGG